MDPQKWKEMRAKNSVEELVAPTPEPQPDEFIINVLNYGSVVVASYLFVFGQSYPFAYAAVMSLPLIGIALTYPGDEQIPFRSPRFSGNLSLMCVAVPVSLSLSSEHLRLPDLTDALITMAAGIVGTAVIAFLFPAFRREPRWLAVIALPMTLYVFGIASFLNYQFDKSPGTQHRTTEVSTTSYRRFAPQIYAHFEQLPDIRITDKAAVAVETGAAICATLHPGALNIRWVEFRICR